MAGPIQSAAGRATVAMGALAGKITSTVMSIYSMASGGSDVSMQESANSNSQQQAAAIRNQNETFKKRLNGGGE